MHQLELRWFAPGSVRAILTDYMAMRAEGITAETRDEDYRWRVEWLIDVFGEATPAEAVTYSLVETAARRDRGLLRDVTIRRRIAFWRAAVQYAAMRGVVAKSAVPEMPPWLRDDTSRGTDFYTLAEFQQFRMAIAPGRFRRYAEIGMWTGMHSLDITTMKRRHLEPDYHWEGSSARGRWWRRNHKNMRGKKGRPSKVEPCWVPMEPELHDASLEWLAERGDPEALIVGPLHNIRRTFHAAAARAGLPAIRANMGLRASHSSLLLARGYSYEYVRIVLGHVHEVRAQEVAGHLVARAVKHGTTLSHYMRPSADILRPRG